MKNILLISENKIKYFSELDPSLEYEKLVLPFIKISQDIQLTQLLGEKFMNTLYTGVENNNLSTTYKTFIDDYVADYLVHYTIYNALPSIYTRIRNKGVLQGTAEEAQVSPLTDMKYLRQHHLELAQFYGERMKDHLCDYSSNFPDYQNPGSKGIQPNKSQTSYFTGLAFKTRAGGRYNGDNAPDANKNK